MSRKLLRLPISGIAIRLLGAFLVLVIFTLPLSAGEYRHRALLISAYHPGFPTFFQHVEGLKSVFDNESVFLDIEFMDSKRFPEPKNSEIFYRLLKNKLNDLPPYDILITADDNALKFALDHQQQLFEKVPIVFLGINDVEFAFAQNANPLVTGLVETVSMLGTLELITLLQPETERIYAVVDKTPTAQGDLKTFYKLQSKFAPVALSHISLEDLTFEEYAERLKKFTKGESALLLAAYHDKEGKSLLYDQSIELTKQNLPGPVYYLWDFGIKAGAFGGKVINHVEQGSTAAKIAVRILKGTPPGEIPVLEKSPNRFMFDYNELKRFGIEPSDLPENSIIQNEKKTYYQLRKKEFWTVFAIFAGYSLLLLAMLLNIRHRRRAEQALRNSEQRFRSLVNQAADAIFLHDIEGRLLDVNETAVQSLGYTREELLQLRVMDIDPAFAENEIPEELWSSLQAGKPKTVEGAHKRKDGSTFPVEIHIGRLDIDENPIFLALVRDITKRKRVEAELRESEERFRSIVQASPMGIMLYRLTEGDQLILTAANPAASRLVKVDLQKRIGMTIEEAFPPLLESDIPERFRRACTLGEAWHTEQLDYEDEEIRGAYDVHAFQIAPGKMATLFLDISERIKTMQALERVLTDAQDARDQIELILKSVADGLLFTDMQHRVVLMSSSAENLLGKCLDQISLQPITTLVDNQQIMILLDNIVGGVKTEGQVKLTLPKEDFSTPLTLQVKSSLVNNRQGQKAGVITLLNDISRERALDQMKNEFISTAAHELRTPLATVMGFVELIMQERDLPEEKIQEYLAITYSKCELLGNLVDDLLDLSRVESGQVIRVRKQAQDIVALLQKSIHSFSRSRNQQLFRMVVPDQPVMVQVDEGKFSQVMSNLLSNAIKFSPADSTISIDCFPSKTEVMIAVNDKGIGMTPEQVERIFDKFYRVDATDTARGGLGLGMSITKSIIEAHDGRIEVDSKPDQGTTIRFYLPLGEGRETA